MGQKQTARGKQTRAASQLQKQAIALNLTEQLRDGADALEGGWRDAPVPGRVANPDALDRDQEQDDAAEVAEPRGEQPPVLRLRDVLGSTKRPRVCLRVRDEAGGVAVEPAFRPKQDTDAAKALDLLRGQLEHVLRAWLKKHPNDGPLLLRGECGTAADRRKLLDTLAVKAGEMIPTADGTSREPNDLTLSRYELKFAAFPDGTAFSLRLLFRDDRGRPLKPDHPLYGRSDDEVRAALDDVLRFEKQEVREKKVKAFNDGEFGKQLYDSFERLGTPIPRSLTQRQVAELRTKFGGEVFPNKLQRQKRYDAETAG